MNLESILIIDDNHIDRMLLKRQLTKEGVTQHIFEAENGQEALDFMTNYEEKRAEYPDKFPPPLIFLDINMPLMNGFQFLEEFEDLISKTSDYSSIVLTMFTSSADQEDIDKAMSYGFVKDYIVKGTYNSKGLKEAISKHF